MNKKKNPILESILSGVNYMLPCVVAGGIMLGISFLVDDISINPANYGTNLPLAAFFNQNGNALFSLMLPVFCAGVAFYIAGKSAIPAALMAGALTRDGDSSFLGALLLGFAVGYLVVALKKAFEKLPETFSILRDLLLVPLISAIVTAILTQFMVEPVIGKLNILMNAGLQSMSGSSQVFLGAILALMQSADMGGPINKTAYLFATAALANGEYSLMSAVLAGALIPPYVTGISTLIFRNKFTKTEKGQGITNLIMGLAGISEGGIPFLLKDPLRVGSACMIGSAIAGGGSILFGCSVMAPFGGLFILPLNANPLGFLMSVALGVVAGVAILGLTKRDVNAAEAEIVQQEA
ncbi:PTS fructose transporter subunit IIC [uncultured Trichococcus sp.]|uniref:PTS fructose transporter subunit IIC n=1 Tax=uncultured Trichococcus sp. TaxID=189665 RepID=UPI0029C6A437|nr:PTS fructose transporter subunit IIC [uncultured Trichococcus sp.]